MKLLILALPSMVLFAGCTASDQKTTAVDQSERTVTVSYDSSGNPFVEVNGEKISIDSNGQDLDKHPPLVVTEYKDNKGRAVVRFDSLASSTEQQ